VKRARRDGSIRVATFNIRHGADPDDRVRPVTLARACAALGADVLGLQEVEQGRRRSWYVGQGRFVAAFLRARHVAGPAIRRSRWRAYGNSLIVRGRVQDVDVLDLPRGPDREPRAAIVARVKVRGVAVSVAVTHLQHRPARLRHLPHDAPEQLSVVLDALRTRPGPHVLLGDLNLQPERALPIFRAAGFTVLEHGPTFPASAPRIQLDYVAFDGLRAEHVEVRHEAPVSDHRAVVADLVADLVP
jgi:endonuclease/exonuclease/phosphatase family metal-dependent hydrolase